VEHVRTDGTAGGEGRPAWPAYRTDRRAAMEIDAQCRVVEDPYAAERRMWQRLEP
jgi:carboxylesterase type B